MTDTKSPEYYKNAIQKLFLIVNKQAETVPFKLNDPQWKILSELKDWDIILKARQEGISSLILALFAIDFLTIENIRCVVIAHESDATQKLFDRVKFYLEALKTTFPGELPYKLKYNSRSELVNTEKNSIFYIGTAGSRSFGRGDTIQNCLASEFAFWPNQEKMYTGLIQAIPKEGRFIIESTANGVGNFHHSLYKKSEVPGSPFRTHFLPWFGLKEYTLPITGTFILTEEEKELQSAYDLTNEQMNWRRWKIAQMNGNLDTFNQEFPATADEAFIVSGNPIWSPSMLKKYLLRCKDPLMVGDLVGAYEPFFEPNEGGMLSIWKEPIRGHNYVIGSDVSEGIEVNTEGEKYERTDFSCAYVMDKQTAELVACMHGRIEADLWGRKLELLGRYYQTAFIGVERNHQGLAPLMVLRDLNYPKLYYREKIGLDADKITAQLGWWTDRFTRPLMVDEGGKWLREERIKIYDSKLLGEMLSFVRYPDGQGRATQGAHDDRCFVAGTKVLTDKGQVPIENIRVGDQVMTRNGYEFVVGIGSRLEEVITNNSLNLTGTPDHPMITKNGVVRLDKLKDTDIIYMWNEKRLSIEEKNITDILNQKEDSSAFIFGDMINGSNRHSPYTDKFGLTILEKFQRVISFITRMKTLLTIGSRISPVYPQPSIPDYTLPKRDDSSPGKTPKDFTTFMGILKKQIAENVTKFLHLPGREEPLSAQTSVLAAIGEKRIVYNIQVDNTHEYFANNILVHNCMSFLLTIQMYLRSPFSNSANEIEGLVPSGDVNDFNFGDRGDDMMLGALDFQL